MYPQRLNALNKKYSESGVPLIAISSTDTVVYDEDTFSNMVIKSRDEKFNYPYLFDEMQTVAKNFGAQKTPHAFVVWIENGKLVVKYNGAIDDNGAEPEKVTSHYVAEAVDSLLLRKQVKTNSTFSIGCQIHFRK